MHYKDGTLAKVGDMVKGKTYNQPNVIAGTMVSITPGHDSCNCKIAYIEISDLDKIGFNNIQVVSFTRDTQGKMVPLVIKEDYGQCDWLDKVV